LASHILADLLARVRTDVESAAQCLISQVLITLGLTALGLNALSLTALSLGALGLNALGAGYLTAADRTSPPVAGPVSAVGVPVRLTLLLITALLTQTLANLILLVRSLRLNGGRRLNVAGLNRTRLKPTRRDGTGLLLACRNTGMNFRWRTCLGINPSGPTTRSTGTVGYRSVERELLSSGTPLPGHGALALLDRGDQVILTHTGDVGDAHLASQLAQLRHHHSRQPGTAPWRRPVAGRRHSTASLVD
jgi:hypothetical protein